MPDGRLGKRVNTPKHYGVSHPINFREENRGVWHPLGPILRCQMECISCSKRVRCVTVVPSYGRSQNLELFVANWRIHAWLLHVSCVWPALPYDVQCFTWLQSEANRVITSNKADRAKVQEGLRVSDSYPFLHMWLHSVARSHVGVMLHAVLQSVFRFPGQAYGALQNTELMEFWRKFRAGTWGGNGEKPLPIPLLTAIDRAVSGSRAGVKPPESPLS